MDNIACEEWLLWDESGMLCVQLLVYWKTVEETVMLISKEIPWILSIQSLDTHQQGAHCTWLRLYQKWGKDNSLLCKTRGIQGAEVQISYNALSEDCS